jgi:hypothetical protein
MIVLCCTAVLGSGCVHRKAKAKVFPWTTAALVRPRLSGTQMAFGDGESVDPQPEIQLELPSPPSTLVPEHVPARPRVAAPQPVPAEAAPKPEAPQIAPQMTAAETAAAQQQTQLSLNIAQRNIETTQGKNLNATQTDLASKIRSFISEAQEAGHNGDWTRARNAAKKAEVLSAELAKSL